MRPAARRELSLAIHPFSRSRPGLLLLSPSSRAVLKFDMSANSTHRSRVTPADEQRMRDVFCFTARTMKTARPVPFGALIVDTRTGKPLLRAISRVARGTIVPAAAV